MKEYIIIEENEVESLLSNDLAIQAIEACFKEKAKGSFFAYAKHNIEGKNGNLCITPGESADLQKIIGFRLYDVIRNDFTNQPQLIVVYDNETGQMKGIVISQLLGAYRTAAINAVMHNYFKKRNVSKLGLVGTGFQARIHLPMFYDFLKPKKISVFNRTKANAQLFVEEMKSHVSGATTWEIVDSIEALYDVDSLLMTSRSTDEFLKNASFPDGMTITTVGPKKKGKSEVSGNFAATCDLLITDSIEQVRKYGEDFFVEELSSIHDFSKVYNDISLKRSNETQTILLCSVGMGGTEIALANKLIEKKLLM